MRGGDQMPLTVHLLQTAQQKAAQDACFLVLYIHRLHVRLSLGIDVGTFDASELEGHAGNSIGFLVQRDPFRRRWLTVRNATGGTVDVNALIVVGLGVVLAPIARIQRHHLRLGTGAGRDSSSNGSRCSTCDGWLLTPTATITWCSLSTGSWQL